MPIYDINPEKNASSQASSALTNRPLIRFLVSALAFLDSYRMCFTYLHSRTYFIKKEKNLKLQIYQKVPPGFLLLQITKHRIASVPCQNLCIIWTTSTNIISLLCSKTWFGAVLDFELSNSILWCLIIFICPEQKSKLTDTKLEKLENGLHSSLILFLSYDLHSSIPHYFYLD